MGDDVLVMMLVRKKKVLFLIVNKKKKFYIAAAVFILVFGMVNTLIFANFSDNSFEGKNIIIDPGHGGVDGGTTDNAGLLEKDINLQISKALQKILVSKKAYTSMTRQTDISLDKENSASSSRHKRDLIARVNQFNSGKYNLYISIHVNRSSNSRAIGPMVLYCPKLPESTLLAQCIQDRLNDHMKHSLNREIRRLPVKSTYYILRNANIPGILVETGFMSNPAEKELVKSESYQVKLAEAIALGIRDYFKADKGDLISNPPLVPVDDKDDSEPLNNIINEIRLVER